MRFFLTSLTVILLLISTLDAKYVCTQDEPFQKWLHQEPIDVNDDTVLTKYSDRVSCESQCREVQNCITSSSSTLIAREIAPVSTSYSQSDKNSIIESVGNKDISSMKITTIEGTTVFETENFNGASFIFPTGDASSGALAKEIYNRDGIAITTYKLYPVVFNEKLLITTSKITEDNKDTLASDVNKLIEDGLSVVGFEINSDKLIFSSSLSKDDFKWIDGEKIVFSNGDYNIKIVTDSTTENKYYIKYDYAGVTRYAFKDSTTDTLKVIYSKKDTSVAYRVKFNIHGKEYIQSSRYISDDAGDVYQDQQLGITAVFDMQGDTCPLYDSNVDLGGDIDFNIFSNSEQCDNSCFIQNSCIEWNDNSKCKPTVYTKSKPISDYTGKTVFTQRDITWDCDTSEVISGECLSYKKNVITDDTTFDLSKIGWKSKEFVSPNEAMTAIAGMEQLQHLWSGWNGMCEDGIMFDDAWMSDPMTLLSFATMAYTGALEGGYGDAMKGYAKSTSNSFDKLTSFGSTSQTVSGTTNVTATATDTFKEIKNFWNINLIDATSYTRAVTNGSAIMDVASLAMAAMSDPVEDDFEMADEFMKAQLGATSSSIAAVNYVQCMASIGLSFPNMVGYSVDSNNSMSAQLRDPWKNMISLSDTQLAALMDATSESYVRAKYLLSSHDDGTGVGKFIPMTALAYTQAGQIICGNGRISKAINMLNEKASDKEEESGMNTNAMAMSLISSALSYLPPPYNLIASIVFKIATSLSDGDACNDPEVAMKWGIQQYKTHKALEFNQCHETDDECAAKWFWGSCMRDRYFYCCYDQEMTRIFVEGIKEQLGKSWEKDECDDIGLEDLKNISFRECLSDEDPKRDNCFPQSSWKELNEVIKKQTVKGFDSSNLTDMAIDSMPIGDDPWGRRVGD